MEGTGADRLRGGAPARPSRRARAFPAASAYSTTSPSARGTLRPDTACSASPSLDFDVHHGQGTQAVVEPDANLFYASTHQYPLYPGTGFARETGMAPTTSSTCRWRPARAAAEFRAAWSERILPALDAFAPELVMVSAGFDAHAADPLAQLEVETEDFDWITGELMAIAARHAQGRVVSVLEGGYDLDALAGSASSHVRILMET